MPPQDRTLTPDRFLDRIQAGFRPRYKVSITTGLQNVARPDGWACRSFDMTSNADQSHALAMECVVLKLGYSARLNVTVPDGTTSEAIDKLNAVIATIQHASS
jgi:hypothetical protein